MDRMLMIHNRYNITMTGKVHPSRFLSFLASSGVKVIGLTESGSVIHFRTDKKGVVFIRKHRRKYRVKVEIRRNEERSLERRLFTAYRFLIACVIPLVASLFLWDITIESEVPEVNERIVKQLEKVSIKKYRPLSKLPDEGEIRRVLMQNDPSLSWVRFTRSGSTMTITPMLSPKLNDPVKDDGPPADLVARTSGVITGFQLSRGERVARLHQTVEKGDILATGILEQGGKKTVVGAAGKVYADYWSKYTFTIPKKIDYALLGEENIRLKWQSPITWNSGNDFPSFRSFLETEWQRNDRKGQFELAEGMEETVIIPLIKYKIMTESSSELIIKDENILHLTFQDDTVRGTILFLMNENIATKRPIPQGD
ncbi:sporulation protein YqfD [Sporosarcina sp. ITBMC105]